MLVAARIVPPRFTQFEVSPIFEPVPVPRSRLHKIGATKLQLIGKHVDA
jgi:hypothetical protein